MDDETRKQIRAEANAVKDCFTTFSFQALALSGALLAAVANYQPKQALVGFAGIFLIIVLLTVSRIGAHKYSTANRQFGFELFCDTLATEEEKRVPWETAMQAWRIVQATLFEKIFYTRDDFAYYEWRRYWITDNVERGYAAACTKKHPSPWFDVARSATSDAKYHAGSYLAAMQAVLHLTAILCLFPIVAMTAQLQNPLYAHLDQQLLGVTIRAWWLSGIVALIATAVVASRIRQMDARRTMLESGVLSISTCAVVWKAVVGAHIRAARSAPSDYLRRISEEAVDTAAAAPCIWCRIEAMADAASSVPPIPRS